MFEEAIQIRSLDIHVKDGPASVCGDSSSGTQSVPFGHRRIGFFVIDTGMLLASTCDEASLIAVRHPGLASLDREYPFAGYDGSVGWTFN